MALKRRLLIFFAALIPALYAGGAAAQDAAQETAQVAELGNAAAAGPVMDQKALDLLKKMSDTITGAKTVSFRVRNMIPLMVPAGIWVDLYGESRVLMQRPDKFFSETKGDFSPYNFYYDGSSITVWSVNKNFYARRPAPATIDAMMEEAYAGENSSCPYADILVSGSYDWLTKDLISAYYVGRSAISGAETDHLAFVNSQIEWQIWIGVEDSLPRMVNAEYLEDIGQPSYAAEFSDWKLDEPIPPESFVFQNTRDAVRIEFRDPGRPASGSSAGDKG